MKTAGNCIILQRLVYQHNQKRKFDNRTLLARKIKKNDRYFLLITLRKGPRQNIYFLYGFPSEPV